MLGSIWVMPTTVLMVSAWQGVCGANDHALRLPTLQGVMHFVRGMCISFSGGYNDLFYDVRCYNRHAAMFF